MKLCLRILSLVLAAACLLSLLSCTPAAPPAGDDPAAYFRNFQPVLRFAALSDVHMDDKGTELEETRLVKVLQTANAYAAKDANHSKLDAVLVAGDFVDYGTKTSMEKFRDLMAQHISADTRMLIALGNHEYYVDKENTPQRFESVFGVGIQEHITINGFHFIKISPDEGGNSYSPETVSWLEAQLAAAAADDPTKPIFVMQHHVVKNTLFLSDYTVSVDNLHPVFSKYPQIVDFSGHSHYPVHNPRQIWQGEYTALGTGTLSYHALIINNLELPPWYTAVHDGTDGSWVLGHKRNKDGGEFYLVEVDATGAVQIIAYDVNADAEIRRYYIRTPSDPDTFLYTNARFAASQVPVFQEGTAVTVSNQRHNGFDLQFPQASCPDTVESYRVEVYSNDILVNTTILTSCFYLSPLPSQMTARVRGLQPQTNYSVKVYAVNPYNKDSQPLTVSVTTGTLELTAAPSAPAPDVFRADFGADGVTNGITGNALSPIGSPHIKHNTELDQYTTLLMGYSGYASTDIAAAYTALSQSVTLEARFRFLDYNTMGGSPVSNLQSGGLGFEIDPNGMAKFTVCVSGSNRTVTAYPLTPGDFVHLVGTYDGQYLRFYINGAPVNELAAPGSITWPADTTAQFIALGGDSAGGGKLEASLKGELAGANVYSQVLTQEEVYRVYLDLNN